MSSNNQSNQIPEVSDVSKKIENVSDSIGSIINRIKNQMKTINAEKELTNTQQIENQNLERKINTLEAVNKKTLESANVINKEVANLNKTIKQTNQQLQQQQQPQTKKQQAAQQSTQQQAAQQLLVKQVNQTNKQVNQANKQVNQANKTLEKTQGGGNKTLEKAQLLDILCIDLFFFGHALLLFLILQEVSQLQ